MVDYGGHLQRICPSLSEINSNWQNAINKRTLLDNHPGFFENYNSNGRNIFAFSNEIFSSHAHLPTNFTDNHQSSVNLSSPVISAACLNGNIKRFGGRKRKLKDERYAEKPKDVIHVRAKRGQATDSHSLAERMRREKINERLRCLQDLVPGCYKTMGMAVMLDVIINYVRSLQNQIEFLSMKLSAASMYLDVNLDRSTAEIMQGTSAYEVQEMKRMVREGGYGG